MIREFLSRRRLIFFPKSWANSVSQWICGVHSPSGTLKIVNTANPSKGKSASFDVDIDAVWNRLRDRIDAIRREDDDQKLRDSKDETFGDKIQNGSTEDLTHDDIADWDEAVENSFVSSDSYGTISDSIGEIADIVDGILTDYLSADDIGVTVAEQDHSHTTADIDDWVTATMDFITNADLSGYALEADLLDVEADVVEIAQEILDINDDLDDLFAWYALGIRSGTLTIGGEVFWDGTTLTQPVQTVSITNGLVTDIGSASTRTIDNPVLFENS